MPGAWYPPQPRGDGRSDRDRNRDRTLTHEVHHSPAYGTVVIQFDADGVYTRRVSLVERCKARVLADRLDRRLAAGEAPETDPLLALRAQQIASPRNRRELAGLVRRILSCAVSGDESPFRARTMAILPRVRKARREFEALADQLEAPAPLPARGMASVNLLLRDGAGPLYRYESTQNLARAVRDITDQLDPSLDWPFD